MDAVTEMLEGAGWPSAAIRTEQFTSDVSRDGDIAAAPKLKRVRTSAKGDYEEIEDTSFFVDDQPHLIREAESFLRQMYFEKGVPEAFQARWDEVRKEIDETGSYVHTVEEITYGTRVAWRNSTRCVGRYFWGSMIVRDMRHIDDERAIFDAMVEHLHLGINGGDLRAVISVFRPGDPQIRIWNPLLLIHAGYEQSDGSILGDPGNAELTAKALALGWPGGSPEDRTRTAYDVLPFIVEIAGRPPQWFEWPAELRRHIHIEHPTFAWFKDLGLRWYQVPAVSGLVLDVGGIQYGCVPSNGFYITTEVGARNFGDASRYNMLPTIAEHMGIDMSHDEAHWKDRAIVELNLAVQYSFRKAGVRMLDHHTICDYFMKFHGDETAAGRETHADWDWIVPPISGSTVKPYHIEYENRILKPNYFYQKAPWSNDRWKSRA
jgi:nitric-oxide synthase